ncbi:MAG: flippase-like domain-containing protein [Verrucomicrobia bacterium]|nr:flippase-like domain-containing protein [Verrucomicrobiota bacterium]
MSPFLRPWLKVAAVAAGVGIFAWLAARVDWRGVEQLLAKVGWAAPLILVPYFVVYVVDTLGWRWCLPPGMEIPFGRLFRIRWTGESVNQVVPSAYVGGEALKVYLLGRSGVAPDAGACSAVVSKTVQSVAQLIFVLSAALAGFHLLGKDQALLWGVGVVVFLGALGLATFLVVLRQGLFETLLKLATWTGIAVSWMSRHRSRLLELDRSIREFDSRHPGRLFRSFLFYLAGWLLDTVELLLVASLLGVPVSWSEALVMEAFTGVAKAVGMWIPGSLGVQEAGIVLLGRVTGLPDAFAVSYAVIRRARETVFALAGLGMLLMESVDWTRVRGLASEKRPPHETKQ